MLKTETIEENIYENVFRHVEVIWDVLGEYKYKNKQYDFMGNLNRKSGLNYCLEDILCHGDRFCYNAESLVKKIFGLTDSPRSNSLHDAEIYHPLFGFLKLEIRCLTDKTYTCYSTENGGGGRSVTEEMNKSGLKTYKEAHDRHLHKLYHTDYFAFVDIMYMPIVRIIIVKSSKFIDLWREGIYAVQTGDKQGLLKLSMSRDYFHNLLFGDKNPNCIEWKRENPWEISKKSINDNLKLVGNLEESPLRVGFRGKAENIRNIDIDTDIKNNPEMYNFVPKIDIIGYGKLKYSESINIFDL